MAFQESLQNILIGIIALVILATFIGSVDPQLSGELTNTAAHPNGLLTLSIFGFIVVAFVIGILVNAFQAGKGEADNIRRQFGRE